MHKVGDVVASLESFAPTSLAEEWDNVGLLVGSLDWPATRVMTCLTVTPSSVKEALEHRADVVVSHHPMPFQPLKAITGATTTGKLLLDLIGGKVAVYSAHTAFDSAQAGINQHLAIGLGLQAIEPLQPIKNSMESDIGAGRMGVTDDGTLLEVAERVKSFLEIDQVRIVGREEQEVDRLAIACGSGGSFLDVALRRGCNCLVTGEANFHACLEAEARGISLVLPGHFASERFAMESLADYLGEQFPRIEFWASQSEHDPLRPI